MASFDASVRPRGRMPLAPTRRQGAWKLAYADFLTALCAFFLVMWLIHGVSGQDKEDLARQFTPPGATVTQTKAAKTAPSSLMPVPPSLLQSGLLSENSMNVSLQRERHALRLDLIDLDRAPLFEKGESQLNARGRNLIEMAAVAIAPTGYAVSIEGHTDSDPVRRKDYSNWELSADRANAARRLLVASGISQSRIRSVSGLADTRPLDSEAADLPQNRRLSIVIHLK